MEKPIPMNMKVRATLIGLSVSLVLVSGLGYGQGRGQQAPSYTPTVTPYDKLPDWSGAWSMMGGTVFDRATQTGQGGAVSVGVREHPPYNAEWEAVYQKSLESIEWGSPNSLGRQGYRPLTFPPAAKVTVRLNPMRNGSPAGGFIGAKFADGTTVGRWDDKVSPSAAAN